LPLLLVSSVTAQSSSLNEIDERSGSRCYHKYVTVSVVKQVPSYSKHCTKVDDTKCKTVFKNAFTTQMETQCVPTFDTSCESTLETAYRQQCKTIKDIECRIVNIEKYGKHHQKKICNEVPVQKCVPVPVKVEGQKCVNVPTQSCETVPVVASVPVPQKQCYKKPRKVCQTLVTTKPKVVTEQVPQEVCGHSALKTKQGRKPKAQKQTGKQKPSPKKELSMFPGGLRPRLKQSESEKVPVFEEPSMGYKKEDIPLFEDASKSVNEYREDDIEEDLFRGYGNNYLDHLEEEDEEMQGYGSNMVQEEVEYDEYREREEARAAALHNYYKQLRGHQSDSFYYPDQHGDEYYEQVDRGFGPQFQKSVDSLMNRVANQVESNRLVDIDRSPSMRVDTVLKADDEQTFIAGDLEGQSFLAGDIADANPDFHTNLIEEESTEEQQEDKMSD